MTRTGSLRQRITVVVMTTTFAALLLSASALLIYELRSYRSTWTADLTTQADLIAQSSAAALTFDDPRAARENLALLRLRPQIQSAAVYTASGRLFASYIARAGLPALPDAPGEIGSRFEGDRLQLFQGVEHNGERVGTLYLMAAYDVGTRLADYLAILVAVTVASLALAAVIFGSLERALTQPILALAQAARDVVGRRDYRLTVQKTTQDEVGVLVDAFNDMLHDLGVEMDQRQKAEDALRTADRRKDEFLATLAHELRNPLAPIVTSLQVLKNSAVSPAARDRAHELMTRQLRQMVRLIDDLLDVSRITTNKLELQCAPLDLVGMVREAVEVTEPLVKERGHALQTQWPGAPLWVEGDATRLTQIVVNLVNNAAKYTDRGGRICVSVGAEGGQAVIRIADNGLGVDASQQAGIFEMFMQVDRSLERERAGLGVGLSLAKRLIELHGGTIEVRSAGIGEGSEFIVGLPLTTTPVPAAAALEVPRLPAKQTAQAQGQGQGQGDAQAPGEAQAQGDAQATAQKDGEAQGPAPLPGEENVLGEVQAQTRLQAHAQAEAQAEVPGEAHARAPEARAPAETPKQEQAPATGRRLRILIADDNADLATSLGDMFEAIGHEVRIAHNGQAALDAALMDPPDVALFDIGMPLISGYELARRLRADERTSDLMMIAITGWGQEADRRLAREAGFNRHLVKPVEPAELFALLDACVPQPTSAPAGA